jgi:hypothetical protein
MLIVGMTSPISNVRASVVQIWRRRNRRPSALASISTGWALDPAAWRRLLASLNPGHILVETSAGLVTTFSVEPAEHGARHIDTVIDAVSQLRAPGQWLKGPSKP